MQFPGSGLSQTVWPLELCLPNKRVWCYTQCSSALQLPAPDPACLDFFSAVYTDVDVMFWSPFDPCTVDRPAVIALTPEVNHRGDPFNTFNSGVMLMNVSVRPVCSLVERCWCAGQLLSSQPL